VQGSRRERLVPNPTKKVEEKVRQSGMRSDRRASRQGRSPPGRTRCALIASSGERRCLALFMKRASSCRTESSLRCRHHAHGERERGKTLIQKVVGAPQPSEGREQAAIRTREVDHHGARC